MKIVVRSIWILSSLPNPMLFVNADKLSRAQIHTTMNFYVYLYFDTRKPGCYEYEGYSFAYEPVYVGKGTRHRYLSHLQRTDNHPLVNKIRKIAEAKLEPRITVLDTASESDAFSLEKKLIALIGRKDKKLGPLCNLTDGGEGAAGLIFPEKSKKILSEKNKGKVVSKRTREKLSLAGKGRKQSSEWSQARTRSRVSNCNHMHTEETKNKLRGIANKRPAPSSETLAKISASLKGRSTWNSGVKTGPRLEEQILNMQLAQQASWQERKTKRDSMYLENPSYCRSCNSVLPYRKRTTSYCNKVCTGLSKRKQK